MCASAAIIGPTNSSASRIARASSGVSRGASAERVAVELLVDVHLVAVELGVDRVAAAAEVDEVEQREVLLELLVRDDGKRREQLGRRDHRVLVLAAGGEQVGEQRLEDGEALRHDRAGGPLGDAVGRGTGDSRGRLRRLALVPVAHAAERRGDLAAQLLRLERDRAPVLAQDPRGELRERRVVGDEDAVLEPAASP